MHFAIAIEIEISTFEFIADADIITIEKSTGKINVNAIDRDARKNEFYPFDVTFKDVSIKMKIVV